MANPQAKKRDISPSTSQGSEPTYRTAMIFRLNMDLEDDVTRPDVALALRRIAASIERLDKSPFEDGDSAPIRNIRGGIIGEWEVTEE